MKQATKAQWQALYDIAYDIQKLKPWEVYGDIELIGLTPRGFSDSFYISVMGMEGEFKGVVVYMGIEGFRDFYRLIASEQLGIPPRYAFYEQTYLSCQYEPVERLTSEQAETAQMLLGEAMYGSVPVFESFKKGYEPSELDELAVLLMTHLLHELKKVLEDTEIKTQCRYGSGEYVHRRYEMPLGTYVHAIDSLPLDLNLVEEIEVTDQLLVKRVEKQPEGAYSVEVDIDYAPLSVEGVDGNRRIQPKMLVICDSESGDVLGHESIGPDMDEIAIVLKKLSEVIMAQGKMEAVYVQNAIVEGMIGDLCDKTGIQLGFVPNLPQINSFLEAFYRSIEDENA